MESNLSEKEHQLLLDAIKEHAIFMIDTEGYIISWNEGAKRLKGYEEEEVMGKHLRMLFLPEDQVGRPEREMKKALDTGKFEEEWWRLKKDGSKFWAHVILQPVFDEHNTHIGFAKITTDRTEQKRLNELNTFLMNQMAGYAIFLLDRKGKISNWSKAAESITGFTEEDALGKFLSMFYQAQKDSSIEPMIARQLAKALEDKYEDENWKVRKDGSYFWASYVIAPLHNKDGFVVMIRDLTEKKNLEQASKANLALEASNRELERFAYVVSHDLNEPIRKISILSDQLQGENPRQQGLVSRIHNACKRARALISDILQLSSLAHAKVFVEQDLTIILQNVLDSLSEQIREKQARVLYQPLPGASVITSQMEQLFQNLIGNAIKFCCAHDQPPLIQIEGRILEQNDVSEEVLNQVHLASRYLEIKVQDNGIGFEAEYATSIFDLFVRLHAKTEYEGTGVGLAICKKVAESHGGCITVYSEKGKGSLFVVTIPANQNAR